MNADPPRTSGTAADELGAPAVSSNDDGPWAALSMIFPVYYTALSLYLHMR